MTKPQFLKKVKGLLRENNKEILKRAERIQASGCVDFEKYENNFVLPKIFMSAVLQDMSNQWMLPTPVFKSEVKNMKHFM